MKILAFDTSGLTGSVSLNDNESILAEWSLSSQETQSRRLLPTVNYILTNTGISLEDIDAFAVTVGPGSFTGIRIGLATVKGLAMATGRPVLGISTLDAIAANFAFTSLPVFPVIDARKKQIFTARYQPDGRGNLIKVTPESVLFPEEFVSKIKEPVILAGDAVPVYQEFFQEHLEARAIFSPSHLAYVRASTVGYLAAKRFLSGERDDAASIVPIYIRPSEAEIKALGATICNP